jgi:diaminopimelate epimerase
MIPATKYHGTGNDFLVVEASAQVPDRRAFGRAVCDRETGVSHPDYPTGADGVLFLELDAEAAPVRVGMHLVQPDGSVAAMCGNGARCVAAWAAERTGADEILVDTDAGTRRARVGPDSISIEMGAPTFEPAEVPVDADEPLIETEVEGLTVTAVNTGVPHAVAFVEDVAAVDLEAVAPPVRHAEVFPEGANVNVAAPNDGGFDQRTFERGVEGETRSCGTGAVAIAAVAQRLGRTDASGGVPVRPPGGELTVTLRADGEAVLEGPVAVEYETEIDPADPVGAKR